jgi:hypothetical protein
LSRAISRPGDQRWRYVRSTDSQSNAPSRGRRRRGASSPAEANDRPRPARRQSTTDLVTPAAYAVSPIWAPGAASANSDRDRNQRYPIRAQEAPRRASSRSRTTPDADPDERPPARSNSNGTSRCAGACSRLPQAGQCARCHARQPPVAAAGGGREATPGRPPRCPLRHRTRSHVRTATFSSRSRGSRPAGARDALAAA